MHIKNYFLAYIITVLLSSPWARGQNQPPQLSNVNVSNTDVPGQLAIRYDLKDNDDESVSVSLELIASDGEIIWPKSNMLTGDIGSGIIPGKRKLLIYDYGNQLVGSADYKLRLIADDGHEADLAQLIDQVNQKDVERLVSTFSRERYFEDNSGNIRKTKQKIEKYFRQNELITERQSFSYQAYEAHNVLGILPGTDPEAVTLVIGAHFDTARGTRGADDNASGIAGMLAIMKILSSHQFKHNICFVAYDLEEVGFVGSKEFVNQYVGKNQQKVEWVLNLDMIGFYSTQPKSQLFPGALKPLFPEAYKQVEDNQFRGDFILCFGDENSVFLTESFMSSASEYAKPLKVVNLTIPDQGNFAPDAFRASDHVSFWDTGIKAISIGDTGAVRNYNVNTSKDTKETLNMNFIINVIKATAATAVDLVQIDRQCIHEIDINLQISGRLTYQMN